MYFLSKNTAGLLCAQRAKKLNRKVDYTRSTRGKLPKELAEMAAKLQEDAGKAAGEADELREENEDLREEVAFL